MLAKIPSNLNNLDKEKKDLELLRLGMIAELDAVNLYEQLASEATDEKIKEVFADIAREEKTHIGEFQTLLLELDKEQVSEMEKGKKEIEELLS